jgi:hypothetical protein
MVDLHKYTFIYENRLRKYLNYGFNIGFYNSNTTDKYGYVKFKEIIDSINSVYKIDYKSENHNYVVDTYDKVSELRKIKNTKRYLMSKRPLYIPTDFPSLVSVARYVVINKIPYKFTFDIPDITIEDDTIKMKLSEQVDIKFSDFIEKIKTQKRLNEVIKSIGYFSK